MTDTTTIRVRRDDLRATDILNAPSRALEAGEILVAIDKFALTANNVTYAVAGDMIGYWKFYPTDEGWGIVPVWGYATVLESQHPDVKPGERFYGYYPFASHAILTPGQVKPSGFRDQTSYRTDLPAVYNSYNNVDAEPEALKGMEEARSLFFPLFITSFLIADFLKDNAFFGAEQVIVGSVSSKTGFGTAYCLRHDDEADVKVIGLTSPSNVDFVEGLNVCDQVIPYGQETALDGSVKTAYVDMSGNAALRRSLHEHFADNLVEDCAVGITHWEGSAGDTTGLPGAAPRMFFAPSQIEKRESDWGPGVVYARAAEVSIQMTNKALETIKIEYVKEAEYAAQIWTQMVSNEISPKRGIMMSLRSDT